MVELMRVEEDSVLPEMFLASIFGVHHSYCCRRRSWGSRLMLAVVQRSRRVTRIPYEVMRKGAA
jgi:hypothetical protein